ncbi:hypothetical protein K438DRAFT_1756100 [Mycena galopus ATCC 62051]|nr:hypothetical protein K438DRAFT_1756100 [Mycena galopus ATCC 62051]
MARHCFDSRPQTDVASDTSDADVVPPPKKKPKAKKKCPAVEYSEAKSDPKPAKNKPGPKPKPKVAPKLAAKSAAKPAKSKKIVDSDDDVEHVTKYKPVPAPLKIVFMIPEATTDGSQRVSLSSTVSFDDAIEVIHETIGCMSVDRKPMLTYKFSTANKNTTTINLCTENDWDSLVDNALPKMKTKKDLSGNISVLPENNKKKTPAKNGKGKVKMTVMDLDNNDSEEGEHDNDEDVAAGENKALIEFETEYRKCCCKIVRHGNHVHLTFPQRRAWAVSLACGTHKVTNQPGRAVQHVPRKGPGGSQPSCRTPHSQYPWLPPMAPVGYGFPSWQMPGAQPAPPHHAVMSSDPPDNAGSTPRFPSGTPFGRPGKHSTLSTTLASTRLRLSPGELRTDKFGSVLRGDAEYLLAQEEGGDKEARPARH